MKTATIKKYVEPLYDAGYDLIPLDGKKPVHNDWVAKPKLSFPLLQQSLKTKADNVGMRLGRPLDDGRYLCVVDVDVLGSLSDEESIALNDALEIAVGGIPLDKAPSVKTGYGNESRHIYVATDTVPRKSLLAKAARTIEYAKAGVTKTGPIWKIELMGYGAQVVIPPSIHPDTKATYRWIRPLNGSAGIPTVDIKAKQKPQWQLKSSSRSKRDPVQLEDVGISPYYKDLLVNGDEHSTYASRSEAIYAILSVLIRDTELDDEQIAELICDENHRIGEKAREAPNPHAWVRNQVSKLRDASPTGGGINLEAELQSLSADSSAAVIRSLIGRIAAAKLPRLNEARVIDQIAKTTGLTKSVVKQEFEAVRPEHTVKEPTDDPVYQEVHSRHAIVMWGGKPAVFRQRAGAPSWESKFEIMTLASLTTCYENKLVRVGKKNVNPVDLWRASPNRNEYLEGAMLAPNGISPPEGYYNLWQGYTVEPKAGSAKPFIDLIRNILCNGNKKYTEWSLDWVADLFQNTHDPKGVAIVLRGKEGIGKGTFGNTLGHIIGPHFRHVTQESQLTGRFNAHFADSTLVVGDEMTWGGDKRNRGVLYSLITEKILMVERKNFDAVPMRNLNRFIIMSNNDWVVPTNIDGRRWFVLDPNDSRKGDTAYFQELYTWLEKGGYAYVLHYFLHRKITHDLRIAPVTQGLIDQKLNALDPVHHWWHECLDRGSLSPLADNWPEDDQIEKDRLYDHYANYCKDRNARLCVQSQFMRVLKQVLPAMEEKRVRRDDKRVRIVILPSHQAAVEHFETLLGKK